MSKLLELIESSEIINNVEKNYRKNRLKHWDLNNFQEEVLEDILVNWKKENDSILDPVIKTKWEKM